MLVVVVGVVEVVIVALDLQAVCVCLVVLW